MTMFFRLSVQLSVEPLTENSVCNSQHAGAITSVLLLNYIAYQLDCFDKSVCSRKAFCLF